jgi:hypothetical protein
MGVSSSKTEVEPIFVLHGLYDDSIQEKYETILRRNKRNYLHELPKEIQRKIASQLDTISSNKYSQASKQDYDSVYEHLENKRIEFQEWRGKIILLKDKEFHTYNPWRGDDDLYHLRIQSHSNSFLFNHKEGKYYNLSFNRDNADYVQAEEVYLIFSNLDQINSQIQERNLDYTRIGSTYLNNSPLLINSQEIPKDVVHILTNQTGF